MNQESLLDYYEILQISPNADRETIDRIYRLLAKRHHPDNGSTGDADKFDIVTKAYRVLSDPERRAEYDAVYKAASHQELKNRLNGLPSEGAEADKKIYQGILCILYGARRRDTLNPGVGIVHLEKLLGGEKSLEFHIWYLKEKGWIQRLENGGLAITACGVDAAIKKDLLLRKDRLLPEFSKFSTNEDSVIDHNQTILILQHKTHPSTFDQAVRDLRTQYSVSIANAIRNTPETLASS